MATEAQNRATAKYRREKVKSQTVRFFTNEMDIWEHLSSQPNKQGYIKSLIREDMRKEQS